MTPLLQGDDEMIPAASQCGAIPSNDLNVGMNLEKCGGDTLGGPIQNTRPLAVTLIALFQFCRAALILLVMLGIWLYPDAHLSSRLDVQVLIYIASRHNLPPAILIPIVMPVIAVCIAVDGWGLWRLQKWARNILMAASGITVLLWLRAFLVLGWAEGQTILKDELARQSVYAVILLDALIFCCLAFYPDVAQAFGEED